MQCQSEGNRGTFLKILLFWGWRWLTEQKNVRFIVELAVFYQNIHASSLNGIQAFTEDLEKSQVSEMKGPYQTWSAPLLKVDIGF